jgi:O-antigen/teichoic acid export membrane protein
LESIEKRIIKGTGLYSFGKILPKTLSFLLIPVYTRFLTPDGYGIVSVVGVVTDILILFLCMGLPNAVTRQYFEYEEGSVELRDYLGTVIIFTLLANFIIVIGLHIFGRPIFNNLFSNVPFIPYIRLALWISLFNVIKEIPMSLYRARERATKYVTLRIINFIFLTGIIVYFVVVLKQGALGKIKGGFYSGLIFFIVFLILSFRECNFVLSKLKLKKALSFGLPLIPHTLSVLILSSADRILLERLASLSEVGFYNVGYQIGGAFILILSSINYAWTPIYYSIAKNDIETNAKRIFSRMATLYIGFGSVLASLLILFSKEIIMLIAAKDFHTAHIVIPVITIGYFFQGMYFMSVRSLYLKNKTYIIALLTGLAAVTNIILNLLWIPKYGMMGAAYATLISYFIQSLLIHLFAQQIYRIPYEYGKLFTTTLLLGLVFTANYFLDIESLSLAIVIKFFIFLSFLSSLFLFKVISIKDLNKIKEIFR